ncbi:hypothetical protein RF11_04436 [Thelohanellus kitauei]|uniref:Uncharacterized protein n=1 Tax=Thelohanellus kitauei TaxID=669202 RepID=A0A0C2M9H3_THEKT|nr:hypothetical protein RF11_04436 [Thelohanellus kitauei]
MPFVSFHDLITDICLGFFISDPKVESAPHFGKNNQSTGTLSHLRVGCVVLLVSGQGMKILQKSLKYRKPLNINFSPNSNSYRKDSVFGVYSYLRFGKKYFD